MEQAIPVTHCEAREHANVEVSESCDDPRKPYQLCAACHRRLLALALRPLEWYNLDRRHAGRPHLLHDESYREDGSASQPQSPVERADSLHAHSLSAAL